MTSLAALAPRLGVSAVAAPTGVLLRPEAPTPVAAPGAPFWPGRDAASSAPGPGGTDGVFSRQDKGPPVKQVLLVHVLLTSLLLRETARGRGHANHRAAAPRPGAHTSAPPSPSRLAPPAGSGASMAPAACKPGSAYSNKGGAIWGWTAAGSGTTSGGA